MASSFSEPSPRHWHLATSVQGQVCIFGGSGVPDKEESVVHLFDSAAESWQSKTAQGQLPPVSRRAACASSGHSVYVHGGEKTNSSFYKLDVHSLEWSQLPEGPERWASGMVVYDGKPFVFGGRDGASYCTNDLHCFDGECIAVG